MPAAGKKAADDKKRADDKKPADKKQPAAEPEKAGAGDKDDDLDDDEDSGATQSAPAAEPELPRPSDEEPAPPPLTEPRPAEQEPRPYLFEPGVLGRERHIDVGPDAGVWLRPADSDSVSYAPAFAWGLHARADLWKFLGFRAYFSTAKHAVSITTGQFGLPGTAVDQPSIEVFQLGARLEPTWAVIPTVRVFGGLGIAWARATAPQPTTSGVSEVSYADRAGVFVETSGMLGASWDIVPRWLSASMLFSAGVLSDQSGDMFQDEQVIDQTGTMRRIAGLPRFKNSQSALFGIGMLL